MTINELTLNAGVVFERTYDILNNRMQSAINRYVLGDKTAQVYSALFVSVAVNGAFGCELFMKSILPEGIHYHELDKLFNQLPQNIQRRSITKALTNVLVTSGIKSYD